MQLNNLDVIILIIVGISALIALSRGLMKEVLSIVGWVLGCAAIIYLLPILNPITEIYVKSGTMAGILTSIVILIVFLVFWILMTGRIVSKIRSSKLSNLDRMLGLFFGVVRACFLIILLNILISWIVPKEKQSDAFKESRYFNLAGEFAEPIENLIPEATLDNIRSKTQNSKILKEENEKDETEVEEVNLEEKSKEEVKNKENAELFEKLAKPRIESKKKKVHTKSKKEFEGYNSNERANMDRLIENIE